MIRLDWDVQLSDIVGHKVDQMEGRRLALNRDCCIGRRICRVRVGDRYLERIIFGKDVGHHSGKSEIEKRLNQGVVQETLLVIDAILETDWLRILIIEIGTNRVGSLAKRIIFGDRCILSRIAPGKAEEIRDEEVERPDVDLADARDELIERCCRPDLDTTVLAAWGEGAARRGEVAGGSGTGRRPRSTTDTIDAAIVDIPRIEVLIDGLVDLELDVLKCEERIGRRRRSTAICKIVIRHRDIGELSYIRRYISDEIPGDIEISEGDREEIEIRGEVPSENVDNHVGISALGGANKDGTEGEGIERGRIVDVGGEYGGLIEEDIEVVCGVTDVGNGDHLGDEGGRGQEGEDEAIVLRHEVEKIWIRLDDGRELIKVGGIGEELDEIVIVVEGEIVDIVVVILLDERLEDGVLGDERVEVVVEADTRELGDGLGTGVQVVGERRTDVIDQLIDIGHGIGDLGDIDEVLEISTVFKKEGHETGIIVEEVDDVGVAVDEVDEGDLVLVEVVGKGADKPIEEGGGCEFILVDVVVVGLVDDVGEGWVKVVDVACVLLGGGSWLVQCDCPEPLETGWS